ncbi:hypothetical protein [Levilactobacillus enshiensis]|uniref:hypothetical protein n=1 Tax=Levilactobacillus enshiensis TaxID=2590213 RepID=UPI001179D7FC|nr:hypothetical protein [Levilactobacillus enshiensis]
MKYVNRRWLMGMIVILGVIGVGLISPVNAQAKAQANFPRKTITYHISSTGRYYQGVWQLAVKNWNRLKVVKLVETRDATTANIVLTTIKTAGKNYAYTDTASYPPVENGDDDSTLETTQSPNYKILLSRKMMKQFYFNKTERAGWGSTAIGDILGLRPSKNFESVMNFSSFKEDKPTKYDKKNLQKLYRNLPV